MGEKTLAAIAALPPLALAIWLRGPFFGPCLSIPIWGVALVMIAFAMRRRAPIALRKGLIVGFAIASIGCIAMWLLMRPPNANEVFTWLTGKPVPIGVAQLQQWNDTIGKDPGYFFRFRTDPISLQALIGQIPDAEECHCGNSLRPPQKYGLFQPAWFRPDELTKPRCWGRHLHIGEGGYTFWIQYDASSQIGYLAWLKL